MRENQAVVRPAELRGLEALRWMAPARLDLLSRRMTVLRMRKGEVIYRPGEPARHVYCVLDGVVSLSLLGSDGRVVELGLLTRGEFFGETALVRGWQRVSQAIALRDSRIGRVDVQTLVAQVCGLPWATFAGLAEVVLKPLFLVSLRRSLFLVEELQDRVALALLEYAGRPEARRARGLLPAPLTHEELAAVVGGSRPRVSLALKALEKAGLFVREKGRLRVRESALRNYLARKYESLV